VPFRFYAYASIVLPRSDSLLVGHFIHWMTRSMRKPSSWFRALRSSCAGTVVAPQIVSCWEKRCILT